MFGIASLFSPMTPGVRCVGVLGGSDGVFGSGRSGILDGVGMFDGVGISEGVAFVLVTIYPSVIFPLIELLYPSIATSFTL